MAPRTAVNALMLWDKINILADLVILFMSFGFLTPVAQ